jgi:hypothetical protein
MEPIFTLPYSEYQVIEQVSRFLKKSEGYALYVPTSRQQKGVDFIIHNTKKNTFARVQVKGSRTYVEEDTHSLWYGNFINRYEKNNADFYMLFGLYQMHTEKGGVKNPDFWKPVTLCFTEKEMFTFLQQVKTKREGKSDRFFAFRFTSPSNIVCSRGPENYDVAQHLLEHQIEKLKKFLDV